MRVAIVRGPNLNAFELQSYEPMREHGVEFTGFTSLHHAYELPAWMDVVKLPCPSDDLTRARWLLRRFLSGMYWRRGTISRLDGLETRLSGFDVLHSAETYNSYTSQCLEASRAHGGKVVITVWENIPYLKLHPAMEAVRQRSLREAHAFVAITERAKAALLLEGAPEERIHVIPVGIDIERFKPRPRNEEVRAKYGVPPDAPLILFAGRLTWEKGLLDLLHAMKLVTLWKRDPPEPPHLVVLGKGEQRGLAEERVRQLGLTGRVHFAGGVPYESTPGYYAAADIFCLGSIPTQSWQEQYGMVLVEAMASGLPVVVASSGSIPEVVGDAALTYQPNDAWDLAETLPRLWDPLVRADFAKRGRARAEAHFDRRQVAQRMLHVYQQLAG